MAVECPWYNMRSLELNPGKLKVLVKPNAKSDEVLGWEGDVLKVAVSAPAVDNKANIAVLKLLKKFSKKRISFISGLKSRKKLLLVQ
ncbi:putative ACR, YggU family [uncultured archaeon]|nr:putative ACR, YggU family [uncultured archaeon]